MKILPALVIGFLAHTAMVKWQAGDTEALPIIALIVALNILALGVKVK